MSFGDAQGSVYMYDLTSEKEFMYQTFVIMHMADLVIETWDKDER